MTGRSDDINLQDVVRTFWRRRRFLLSCLLVGAGLGALVGVNREPSYTAEAQLAIAPQENRVLTSDAVMARLDATATTAATQVNIVRSRQRLRETATSDAG